MSIEKRIMYVVLVPASRGKKRFSYEDHHKVFDAKVKEICGGITIHKTVKGEWIAPDGTIFTDRMIPVMIAVKTVEEIEEIARFALDHYDEEAIMYYKVSDDVRILHRDR